MNSYPASSQVFADLGDKVLAAIHRAVALTRTDLTAYREQHPLWVAQHSERGLASWIHDRLWHHLSVLLDGMDDIALVDSEPTRELGVGLNYKLRMKRHHDDGAVSTYPTITALEFMAQEGQLPLAGLEEVRLIAGYNWLKDERDVGPAVMSLRDGRDNIIWVEEIPSAEGDEGAGGVTRPVIPQPSKPTIDARQAGAGRDEENIAE